MTDTTALAAEALRTRCDPEQFDFDTTTDLEELSEVIGQARALEAIRFGITIRREGYNLFVLGETGAGKHTVVREYLEQQAAHEELPSDWCYVNDFEVPHKPRSLRLLPGQGVEFREDVSHLIEDLRAALPSAFETDEYHARVQEISDAFEERREQAFSELTSAAEKHNIRLIRTPGGFAFAPMKDNAVIEPADFQRLPEQEQKRIEEHISVLQEQLTAILRAVPQWRRETREKLKALNREVAMYTVGHLIEDLKKKYQDIPRVPEYMDAVQQDVVDHVDDFLQREEESPAISIGLAETPSFHRYEVNVLVSHRDSGGAPVVYEDNPLYQNLVGRIEHVSRMGALTTDFTLIKPGALHLANGGYLILDARKVLISPYAWEGLKRALASREVRIQSLGEMFSLISTVSLEPEPIPLDVKVVLVGERLLFYLLQAYDPDFGELFKVAADFEDRLDRTTDNNLMYARMVATLARKEKLMPLNRHAVARVIEHSAKLVGDAEKLSTHMLSVTDLLRQADYWARHDGRDVIGMEHVQQAIDAEIRRADRIRNRVQEEILRGTVLIDTAGETTGQVNGLSVINLGNFTFAQPSRITATARVGEGEVVDIEREVELGGAIHSKGVFILSSLLAARYARKRPLSVSASVVFEQSYGGVEGDSASMGEFCALLSAIGELPIRQSLAITGSVNQHGQVQAIGGVNDKIEGFFDICRSRGLDGEHGVLIPASNVKHLMLRDDVVEAARAGQFSIYPVSTVDEAMELLTGLPAGEVDEQGVYPEGTVNRRVADRLQEMAAEREAFAKGRSKKVPRESGDDE
ncbi:MAG: AAA family ATPase [Pseudomonadota bacterium]|nr:MAG: AAA family ATPase [Pseudomonadota bacterium]